MSARRLLRRIRGAEHRLPLRERQLEQLSGHGLEIGALHNPARLPPGATVSYVDQFDVDELRRRNPEVPADAVVAPDIICDSHRLDGVPDGSVDFIVASHVVEHLHNPIAALLDWRRVLVDGGRVVCVVPDGRFTFDRGRPFTGLQHLLWDYVNDGSDLKALSDLFHIAECNLNMHATLERDSAVELARTIFDETYDTHFHVWSFATFSGHVRTLIERYGFPYRIASADSDEEAEMVVVLEAGAGEFDVPADDVVRAAR